MRDRKLAIVVGVGLILGLVAMCAMGAQPLRNGQPATPVAATIDGKEVLVGQRFADKPMMEVRNLRFWDAKLKETMAQCTVITGELWNMTDGEGWSVTIEVDVWSGSAEAFHLGAFTTTINRPGRRVAIPFRLLAPGTYNPNHWRDGCRAMHTIRLTVGPPKD